MGEGMEWRGEGARSAPKLAWPQNYFPGAALFSACDCRIEKLCKNETTFAIDK